MILVITFLIFIFFYWIISSFCSRECLKISFLSIFKILSHITDYRKFFYCYSKLIIIRYWLYTLCLSFESFIDMDMKRKRLYFNRTHYDQIAIVSSSCNEAWLFYMVFILRYIHKWFFYYVKTKKVMFYHYLDKKERYSDKNRSFSLSLLKLYVQCFLCYMYSIQK